MIVSPDYAAADDEIPNIVGEVCSPTWMIAETA